MISKQLLKSLNRISVRYTFKLPWKLVEDNMPFVISDTQTIIELMFRDDTMRLPFGPENIHCFYPDTGLTMEPDGNSTPTPQAICATQNPDNKNIMLTIFDETGSVIVHNGYSIAATLNYADGESFMLFKKLSLTKDEEPIIIDNPNDLTDIILAKIDIAITVFTASMYALYYRESKTITRNLSFIRSARQNINKPTDYLIQVARKKYVYSNGIKQPTLERKLKSPHTRRGHWCYSRKILGKRWWKNPCKIHGGGDLQNYKI